jgi:hypothetical protein
MPLTSQTENSHPQTRKLRREEQKSKIGNRKSAIGGITRGLQEYAVVGSAIAAFQQLF